MNASKLICSRCQAKVTQAVKLPDGSSLCFQCNEEINRIEISDDFIPKKPSIVYLWNQKLSLMGSYPDGEERYMITIPKTKREDFFLKEKYDVKFILKTKEFGKIDVSEIFEKG